MRRVQHHERCDAHLDRERGDREKERGCVREGEIKKSKPIRWNRLKEHHGSVKTTKERYNFHSKFYPIERTVLFLCRNFVVTYKTRHSNAYLRALPRFFRHFMFSILNLDFCYVTTLLGFLERARSKKVPNIDLD